MKFLLLVLTFLISYSANCQISFDTSKISSEYTNSKTCWNYLYNAAIPVFHSENEIIKNVNDSIYHICENNFDISAYSSFPGIHDLFSAESCSGNAEASPSTTDISFTIFSNSDSLLSFYIDVEGILGGGGHGSKEEVFAFNLGLKNDNFINWKTQLDNSFLEKAILLINKTKAARHEFDEVDPLSLNDIKNVCLADKTIRFFYPVSSGLHEWNEFIDIPVENKVSKKKRKHKRLY